MPSLIRRENPAGTDALGQGYVLDARGVVAMIRAGAPTDANAHIWVLPGVEGPCFFVGTARGVCVHARCALWIGSLASVRSGGLLRAIRARWPTDHGLPFVLRRDRQLYRALSLVVGARRV